MSLDSHDTKRVEKVERGIRVKELTLTCATPFLARCAVAQATGEVYKDGNEFYVSGNSKARLQGASITVTAVRNEQALVEAEQAFDALHAAADAIEEQLRGGVLAVLISDFLAMDQEVIKIDDRIRDVRVSVAQAEDKVRSLGLIADSIDRRVGYLEREAEKAAADFDARLETADAEIGALHEENSALKLCIAQLDERIAAIEAQQRDRWYRRLWRWLRRGRA